MNNILRFHLKTWQWVSVLVVMAVIVGGVFTIFSLSECQKCYLLHWRPIGACDRICLSIPPDDSIQQTNYCQTESDCIWVCGCGCINKERKCEIPEGIMYDCYPGMEEKYSCACLDNQCKTVKVDVPVQQITITTDKTEYEEKEDVKVVVNNNLDIPLYIYDCDPLELVKAEDNSHVRGGLECLPNLILGIKPQELKNLVKPLSYYSELKGKFKIKLFTYPGCDETVNNWQHRPKQACGEPKTVYSNEFRIKIGKISDLGLAQEVLIKYFSLLNEGKYSEAVKYHGSGYDYIQPSCPKIDLSNYAGLLECGCHFLVCENINIVKKEQLSTNEFVLTVQFVNKDGSLVKSYPYCCGEEPPKGEANIPKTEFEYRVEKVSADFFVITPLLYVP